MPGPTCTVSSRAAVARAGAGPGTRWYTGWTSQGQVLVPLGRRRGRAGGGGDDGRAGRSPQGQPVTSDQDGLAVPGVGPVVEQHPDRGCLRLPFRHADPQLPGAGRGWLGVSTGLDRGRGPARVSDVQQPAAAEGRHVRCPAGQQWICLPALSAAHTPCAGSAGGGWERPPTDIARRRVRHAINGRRSASGPSSIGPWGNGLGDSTM